MNGADDAEVLGVSPSNIVIHRARSEVRLQLNPGALQRLSAGFSAEAGQHAVERVYLALKGIQGTQDASALTIRLRLPDEPDSDSAPRFNAGAVGLYGLRRATVANASHAEPGLRSVLDVTPFFRDATASGSVPSTNSVVVSIELARELPVAAAIVIGQLVLFHEHYAQP